MGRGDALKRELLMAELRLSKELFKLTFKSNATDETLKQIRKELNKK